MKKMDDKQKSLNTDINISTREHRHLNDDGDLIGKKYSVVIYCDGLVLSTPWFFADEKFIVEKLNSMRESLRKAKITVEFH